MKGFLSSSKFYMNYTKSYEKYLINFIFTLSNDLIFMYLSL